MPSDSTRRTFIVGVGGAGLLLPMSQAGASPETKKIAPNDKIRIACIGLGIMGNKDCVFALKVPGVELVAACDLYTGRLERPRKTSAKT